MGTRGASSVVEQPEREAELTMGGVIFLHISSWLPQ